MAKYVAVTIVTDPLARFLSSYENISLADIILEYEPLINLRPKKMMLQVRLPVVTE